MAVDVGGPKSGVRPTMNVTPLVDVVLVLLIIFMVITPLLAKQFSLQVPPEEKTDTPPPPADTPPPVVLSVHADGSLHLNRETVARGELTERVRRAMAASSDKVVFFDAEDDASYGAAMEALDLARGAGAVTIAVLPDKLR